MLAIKKRCCKVASFFVHKTYCVNFVKKPKFAKRGKRKELKFVSNKPKTSLFKSGS